MVGSNPPSPLGLLAVPISVVFTGIALDLIAILLPTTVTIETALAGFAAGLVVSGVAWFLTERRRVQVLALRVSANPTT